MIKYSVIIPVYNSEKTLARCLDSLLGQGREDVQIVVVNDGSTDNSADIIREYRLRYPEIHYIFQENGGVSKARNAGLKVAVGKFITFVDSDDYVAPNYFLDLDTADNSDLVVFAHENVGGKQIDEKALFSQLQKLETMEMRLSLLLESRKIMSPWNKRFDAELIKCRDLHFLHDMHTGEDFNFCVAYALCCKSISILAKKLIYIDVSDQESLSRKYRPNLDEKLGAVFAKVSETIHNSDTNVEIKRNLLSITDFLYIKHVFSCICEEFKQTKLSYRKDEKRIAEICEQFRKPISESRVNIMHRVLRWVLAWKCYYLFYLVAYWVKGRKYKK